MSTTPDHTYNDGDKEDVEHNEMRRIILACSEAMLKRAEPAGDPDEDPKEYGHEAKFDGIFDGVDTAGVTTSTRRPVGTPQVMVRWTRHVLQVRTTVKRTRKPEVGSVGGGGDESWR